MKKPDLKQPSKLTSKSKEAVTASALVDDMTSGGIDGEGSTGEQPRRSIGTPLEDLNALIKYGTRITRGQVSRIKSLLKEHHTRNPTAASLKQEEVVRFALDNLFAQKDPVALISEGRR